MFIALFLLAVSVGVLANEVRTIRALDRLWESQRARLLALNKRGYSRIGDPLAYKISIERTLFWGDPDRFEWAPGAVWLVDDPRHVQVLDARLAS